MTRQAEPPAGYKVDRYAVSLGAGRSVFETARGCLQHWAMFDLGWVQVYPPDTPIQEGAVVAVVIAHLGFWSVNLDRILYVQEVERSYSFAYGTLTEHAEMGEERFTIRWDSGSDLVWYEILAISTPRHILAKLGYPIVRMLQKRFGRDSMRAMALQ